MKMLDPDHQLPSILRGVAAFCVSPKTKATNQVYVDLIRILLINMNRNEIHDKCLARISNIMAPDSSRKKNPIWLQSATLSKR
jgi:hypothetical protein